MLDLLITHATLPDGRQNMSVAVQGGRITELTPGLQAPAHETESQRRARVTAQIEQAWGKR